jgi:hypothetical protein
LKTHKVLTLRTSMPENCRGLRKSSGSSGLYSDFIEEFVFTAKITKSTKLKHTKVFSRGGFETRPYGVSFASFVSFVVNTSFHLVAALPRWSFGRFVVRRKLSDSVIQRVANQER